MTKQATARNAADDAKNAANDAKEAATDVATDAKNLTADTQKSLGNNIEKFSQRLQGLSSFSQQNLEAFARSSEITAKALESIGGEVAAYTKRSYEDRVAAAQDISTARTLTELVEKQTSFAQHAFEGWAQQAIRISAIYTSAAKDIAAPLGERISSATEEMKSRAR